MFLKGEKNMLVLDMSSNAEPHSPILRRKRNSGAGMTSSTRLNAGSRRNARASIGTPGKVVNLDQQRGAEIERSFIALEVSAAYKAIRKQTGSLGGNAAGGAIYGEITQNSFQRVVDFLKENCALTSESLFLDIGSGLGKPNFHVAVDPGVQVSYGVELEELRWHLSLHNLKSILGLDINRARQNRTIFTAGDITDANSLDPFTHIYSFDVGFPPTVMDHIADIFNKSRANYFASFHPPRKVIEIYGFDVINIGRVATSMSGSSEGHTCYFYRRNYERASVKKNGAIEIDPLFRAGFDILSRGKDGALAWIESFFGEQYEGRTRRQKRSRNQELARSSERPLESYYRVVGKAHAEGPNAKKKRFTASA
jgi:hypothetical protein